MKIAESSLSRTAKLLAHAHNFKVVFKEGEAFTSPTQITLPAIPDNADQQVLDAMEGYLDQQVGHILFGDPNRLNNLKSSKKEVKLHSIYKSLEDARVEAQMASLYPGSVVNLRNSAAFVASKVTANLETYTPASKFMFGAYLEQRYPGTNFVKSVFQDPEEKALLDSITSLINAEPPRTPGDSYKLAEKIKELFEENEEENEEEDTEEGEDEEEDTEEGEDEEEDTEEGEDEDEEDEGAEGADDADQEDSGGPSISAAELLQAAVDQVYEHNLDGSGGYTIWDTSNDYIGAVRDLTLQNSGSELQQLREDSQHISSVMRKRLVNSLRASQKRRWVGGRPEGRLDGRKAYKAIHGLATNVYKIRTKKPCLDTAISLAIDHSGSMHGSRLILSAQAAVTLGDVFSPLSIPFSVYGFSTRSNSWPTDTTRYARWNSLWIEHYKTYNESWNQGALKMTKVSSNCQANTLDGESILYGARQLLARPEKRKILFVFNDGGPFPGDGNVGRCQQYLRDVITAATNAGIEIVCFGVQTDEVRHYYPNWVMINDLEDLVKEPLTKIDALLRKGARNF